MSVVYKYPVEPADVVAGLGRFSLILPQGARVVLVGMQRGHMHLWAIVDPEASSVRREFQLCGTGHTIDHEVVHLGSFMQNDGAFVWRLFEHGLSKTGDGGSVP